MVQLEHAKGGLDLKAQIEELTNLVGINHEHQSLPVVVGVEGGGENLGARKRHTQQT